MMKPSRSSFFAASRLVRPPQAAPPSSQVKSGTAKAVSPATATSQEARQERADLLEATIESIAAERAAEAIEKASLYISWGIELCRVIELREWQLTGYEGVMLSQHLFAGKDVARIMASRDDYNALCFGRKIFVNKGLHKNAAGEEVPLIVPGPLLVGVVEQSSRWSSSLNRLHHALLHLKDVYWCGSPEQIAVRQGFVAEKIKPWLNADLWEMEKHFNYQ